MNDKFLNIVHVGGRGSGIGPISELMDELKDDAELTIFEADYSLNNAGLSEFSYKAKIIYKCLSNYIGKSEFNINADPRASSLFDVSQDALEYASPKPWGENCKTKYKIKVDVTTINDLAKIGEIELPHFISLDAQGSEYDILEGASDAFNSNLIAVITEIEFREIYAKQKLFFAQDELLHSHMFDLYHFFNWQFWHSQTEYIEGDEGFPLTAEALYLRDFRYFLNKNDDLSLKLDNLARLISIATYFRKTSYAYKILKYIKTNLDIEWCDFIKQRNCNYLTQINKALESKIKI